MKTLLTFITSVFMILLMTSFVVGETGWNPYAVLSTFTGISVGLSFIPAMQGVAFAGVFKEIWTTQLMERFYAIGNFLSFAQDMTEFVEFNTINLADIGVDPDVLINNTAFPIPSAPRADTPLALVLDSFDTKNTIVRNIEEIETSFNKRESVIRQHRNSLMQSTSIKAAHSYTPVSDSADTPVLATTGPDDGNGFKRLLLEDIFRLRTAYDILEVPHEFRFLTLHPNHVQDISVQDKDLFKQFTNLAEGTVMRLSSFQILEYSQTATFNKGTGVKAAFGAAAAPATDTVSSFSFHSQEVMKVDGTIEIFERLKDPEERGDILGFQKRFLALPTRNKFNGAIYSPAV